MKTRTIVKFILQLQANRKQLLGCHGRLPETIPTDKNSFAIPVDIPVWILRGQITPPRNIRIEKCRSPFCKLMCQ